MPPPKEEACVAEKRKGRQSVVPVARLGTVVVPGRLVVGQEARPGPINSNHTTERIRVLVLWIKEMSSI
jgi:hypothetical protein